MIALGTIFTGGIVMYIPESNLGVVIFVAGIVGSQALNYLRERGCRMLAFIDNEDF